MFSPKISAYLTQIFLWAGFFNLFEMSGIYYFVFLKAFAYFNGTNNATKNISTAFSKTCLESNLDIAPP